MMKTIKLPKLQHVMLIYLLPTLLLLWVGFQKAVYDIPVRFYFSDTIMITQAERNSVAPGFVGIAGIGSQISIFLWVATVTICIFTYLILPEDQTQLRRFILFGAMINFGLLLDDAFLFHEGILPWVFKLPQESFVLLYIPVIVGYLYYFRDILLRGHYGLLALALVFFGMSLFIDLLHLLRECCYDLSYLLEDGTKLYGIVSWANYFFFFAFQAIEHFEQEEHNR